MFFTLSVFYRKGYLPATCLEEYRFDPLLLFFLLKILWDASQKGQI